MAIRASRGDLTNVART
ncbi:uncharacterized protein FTOL_13873 [Fusarium torulosum]|uniref:Uncharacterized protein n=1 Tax=Fusarium torulosum TaxID=33205 RepID=A0AAE8MMV2_9HYPO|nr:uncharacterized protein FTOL_13873 [Fusarium torulosum]